MFQTELWSEIIIN